MFCLFSLVSIGLTKLNFPPEDFEKYGRSKYACTIFKLFFPVVVALSKFCLNFFIFPALNTHAPCFFHFLVSNFKLKEMFNYKISFASRLLKLTLFTRVINSFHCNLYYLLNNIV